VNKVIYFASDFHLGLDWIESSADRERRIVQWLKEISKDADELHLVGDLFDFWFEYKKVVPKGYIRFLGQLATMSDQGIVIHVYRGNHDMWMQEYLRDELGVIIHSEPHVFAIGDKTFYVHHGDKILTETRQFKFLRRFFDSALCQWLFQRIHPNLGMWIGQTWSVKSRNRHPDIHPFSEQSERLISDCERVLAEQPTIDYFICGHRHLPVDFTLSNNTSRYVNLGDWFYHAYGYARFEDNQLELKSTTWEAFNQEP